MCWATWWNMWPSEVKIVITMFVVNTILSTIHAGLVKIKDKTETPWDNRLDDVICKLLTILNYLMANRRNPPK